ncbi:MAG: zinc-ribbon domain-containing protein [Terriglobales bacterium]
MICPKCGEDNSDNFRFCGMCGTLLDARRPAGAPAANPLPSTTPKIGITSAPEPLQPLVVENAGKTANERVPPIGGPSMLGLNQPGPSHPSPHQPSMDSLRDKAFSGLDSFFEPEQPKTGGRRILLLVALLAALGGAGWWTYTNYLSATGSQKATVQDVAPAPNAGSSPAAAPSARVPEGPSKNASASPDSSQKSADAEAKSAPEEKPLTPAPVTPPATPAVTPPKIAPHEKIAAKREPKMSSPKASNVSAPGAADTGDADFRKGEAYLYGRGAPENCDEAVKYLKAASAQLNAKARSAFGTMYATGHCVPRDLPTSYLWFALALRVDPNNQILEKDLSAVWNQMTPPERQMATRMKQ